jgi:hypothetical protein
MLDQRMHALSAQISKMTPQQRQQFAMLHKNDPILVSMTKFINDQENSLRSSMQAQQNPQALAEKPKIVDEMIAGLAGVPAPNLEQMPDGGIAGGESPPQGYAEGGITGPRAKYDYKMMTPKPSTGTPYEGMGVLEFLRKFGDDTGITQSEQDARSKLSKVPNSLPSWEEYKAMITPNAWKTPDTTSSPKIGAMEKDLTHVGGDMPTLPNPATPAATARTVDPEFAEFERAYAEASKSSGRGGGGGGIAAIPSAPASNFEAQYNKYVQANMKDPFAAEIAALNEARLKSAAEERDRVKADQEEMGIAGLEREKRLKAKEAKLEKKESQNAGMALLDAGLAMMAGKSRHALVNIGQGAMVGTKRYREGAKEIEDARDKLDDAFSSLEDLRRGEKRGDLKDRREAEAKYQATIHENMDRVIKGLQTQYGISHNVAKSLLTANIQEANNLRDNATRITTANIGAGATMGAARLRNKEGLAGLALEKLKLARDRQGFLEQQKGAELLEKVEGAIEKRIENEHKLDPYTPMTPQRANEIRTQAWQEAVARNPFLKQYIGTMPQAAAPATRANTTGIKYLGTE